MVHQVWQPCSLCQRCWQHGVINKCETCHQKTASNDEVLVGLERFLSEFFHPSTSNQRKREIEDQLNRFGNQNGSWKHCLYVFTKSRNEFVLMYCLSVLENLVNKMWIGLDSNSKDEIRTSLNQILLMQHKELPTFITHKLIKVIVDIGRVDWPMFYPDFFSSLLQLASSSNSDQFGDTRAIGLAALRIASEELVAPREDISAQRKEELKKLLSIQVPNIIKVVTETLHVEWLKCFVQFAQMSMATPPPSPSSDGHNLFDLFTPVDENVLPKVSGSIEIPPQSLALMTLSLECLCHFFGWISLSSNITGELLSVVFQYARLGCCTNVSQSSVSILSNLGSHAMTCINELLTRNCVPQNFEDYLVRIFRHIFHILQLLTRGDNSRHILENLDDNYLEKFVEFLRLFVSTHFSRIESNPSFPLIPFLTLLYKFTFNQSSHEYYLNCLDIWEIFIDYVITKCGQLKSDTSAFLERYKHGMVSFATSIFQHIQFRFNFSQLEDLDHSACNDDGHTEWQTYLIENLEILAKICSLFPSEMMVILYPVLEDTATVYLKTDWSSVGDAQNIQRLRCVLRDLTTTLQAFGRVSELFISEHFHSRMSDANSLIKKLLTIATYGSQSKLFEQTTRLPPPLLHDVIEVHAEVLASLQPYTHWLSQLYSEAQQAGHSQAQLSQLLDGYVEVVIPVLSKQVPDKIVLSAAHTLLSVVTTIRATFLAHHPAIEKLFEDVTNGSCNKLQTQTQHLIYKALSNILIQPWPNTPEQEQKWDARERSHSDFVSALLSDYLALSVDVYRLQNDKAARDDAKPRIHRAMLIAVELVDASADEVAKSRQICFSSFKQTIALALDLFPFYLEHPDTTEIFFSHFLSIFSSLRRQMGVEMITRTIQLFLSKFTQEQLHHIVLHENQAGVRVIEKLLKILQMIIDEPGNSFKSFTSNIILFAVEQVYPIVSQRPSPDVKGAIFDLLHHILLRRYRYFFPSQIIASLLTDEPISSKGGNISHKSHFLAIMTAFGNSFLQPDITVFRQTLSILEDLNRKMKFYDKVHHILSQEQILFQFVNVLIQALIAKSHDLLQEEICLTIFNMASTDLSFYHDVFIKQFLHNTENLTQDQKSTLLRSFRAVEDLPSFSANLLRFVNDLRYYRICNSSLPDGTVQF